MSNFIKCEENKEIVNLDLVTYIYPVPAVKAGKHKIYFVFPSMNNEEVLEVIWEFDNLEDFNRVLDFLDVKVINIAKGE